MKKMKIEREEILSELIGLQGWVTGSLVKTERTQAGKKRPFQYLSRSINGTNRITYVAVGDLKTFTEGIRKSKRARKLFERISELTIAIIKAEGKQMKGQQS